MKRFLFLFILCYYNFFGQITWQETNIPNSISRYDDVFFLNENIGWAADGTGAKVYKTNDGGESWEQQFQDSQNYFRNIEFLNENIGFLGTLNGSFFKTIDGGTSWQTIVLPNSISAICGLDCIGASTIYGCGAYFEPAYVIKSSNSGVTWQTIDMSDYATGLVEVLFVTENVGFASGKSALGGVILKTLDAGATWQTIYQTTIPGEYIWKLQILDSNPAVMFASVSSVSPFNGKLLKSTNQGVSWVSRDVPDTNIQAVGFVTENHGWMGGHDSGFLETLDAGQTWSDTGFGDSLNRIFFVNQNVAYTAGNSIYKLTNGLGTSTKNTVFGRKELTIRINPNPIIDKLNVEIDFESKDNLLIELYSLDGKLLKKMLRDTSINKGQKKYSIDFPFPKGSYIVNFHTNTGRQFSKIIK